MPIFTASRKFEKTVAIVKDLLYLIAVK